MNYLYKILIGILLLFSNPVLIKAQLYNQSWLKTYGNDSVPSDIQIVKLCTDHRGNVYVVSNKDSSSYWKVIMLTKYNVSGQKLWNRIYTDSIHYSATAVTMACDGNNNIYIGGEEEKPIGVGDYLVLKYDSSGNFQWKFNYNGIGNYYDELVAMQIDNANNIYITGRGALTGDPTYYTDVLTCKLDSGGNLIWYKYLNYPGNINVEDIPKTLNLDKQNNLIIAGNIQSGEICKMDSAGNILWVGPPISTTHYIYDVALDDSSSSYLVGDLMNGSTIEKYDSSGNLIWQKPIIPPSYIFLSSIKYKDNYLYATGVMDSACIIVKLNLNGDTIWTRYFNSGPGLIDAGQKIICHGDGDLTILESEVDTGHINSNIVALRYDSTGNLLWHQIYDNSLNKNDYLMDAVSDTAKNIYIGAYIYLYSYSYAVVNFNSSGSIGWIDEEENFQNSADAGNKIIKDNSGNIIVTGQNTSRYLTNDIFILKYDPSGNLLWNRRINSTQRYSNASQTITDADNNIYVCGNTFTNSGGIVSMLIIKLDSLGNIIFNNIYFGNGNNEGASSISTDIDKNIYVMGTIRDSLGMNNVIFSKVDSIGNLIWNKTIADSAYSGNECLINTGHNIFYCGYTIFNSPSNHTDIGIAKIDSSGNIIWKKYYNSSASLEDMYEKISIDNDENIIIAGTSDSILWDLIVVKYDSSGNYLWATRNYNTNVERNTPSGMAIDSFNNIYIASREDNPYVGSYCSTIKLSPDGNIKWYNEFIGHDSLETANGISVGDGNVFITGSTFSTNNYSLLILVYDTLGNEIYFDTLRTTGNFNAAIGNDILFDNNGCFYITGEADNFRNASDFITMKYCNSILGINNPTFYKSAIELFPNPAANNVSILFISDRNYPVSIEAYDMMGSKVLDQKVFAKEGKNIFQIDNQLNPGSYLFMLKLNDQVIGESRLIRME